MLGTPRTFPLSGFSELETRCQALQIRIGSFGIGVKSLAEARICRPAQDHAALQGLWGLTIAAGPGLGTITLLNLI